MKICHTSAAVAVALNGGFTSPLGVPYESSTASIGIFRLLSASGGQALP